MRNGPTRRAATGPKAIDPIARGRRAMVTVPVATGPSENSAATRSFRVVRPGTAAAALAIAARARISATVPTAVPIVAIQNRGRSATPVRPTMPDAIHARPVTARAILTDRAAIVRRAIVRFASGRNSTVPAKAATNVRVATVLVSIARARIVPVRTVRSSIDRVKAGSSWQEHPRSDSRHERPRRDNEDDSKVFAKRPAFGGRGEYRERRPDVDKRAARPPRQKKSGERIAKVVSRAGLASRRDAEEWIVQGRVTVNGRVINSPALDVTGNDVITIDGKPLPPRERTRLFMFHKPRGLMTTHADPEGRPTVFDNLPEGLPRLISIGRLDFNTEGLLLLTNDGGLARALELPDTGWLRRYRVRAHGEVTQAQLDELKKGVEVDGVKYGSIDATLERDQGANVWLVFAIREGKNREVRNVMAHLGLEVNRLIRVSYGPFQLGELSEGAGRGSQDPGAARTARREDRRTRRRRFQPADAGRDCGIR